jgi:hypothetical protein
MVSERFEHVLFCLNHTPNKITVEIRISGELLFSLCKYIPSRKRNYISAIFRGNKRNSQFPAGLCVGSAPQIFSPAHKKTKFKILTNSPNLYGSGFLVLTLCLINTLKPNPTYVRFRDLTKVSGT